MDSIHQNNFTQVPNIVDEIDLSPLAIALYLHYRRWSGVRSRSPNVRALKTKYGVGAKTIAAAKQELVDHRLIQVETRPAKGLPDRVVVVDIWKRNSIYFKDVKSQPVPDEEQVVEPVPNQEQVCSQIGTGVFLDRYSLKDSYKNI